MATGKGGPTATLAAQDATAPLIRRGAPANRL